MPTIWHADAFRVVAVARFGVEPLLTSVVVPGDMTPWLVALGLPRRARWANSRSSTCSIARVAASH